MSSNITPTRAHARIARTIHSTCASLLVLALGQATYASDVSPSPNSVTSAAQTRVLTTADEAASVTRATHKKVVQDLKRQPLLFEPNRGHSDPEVLFVARGRGYQLFLTESEAVPPSHCRQVTVGVAASAISTTNPSDKSV